jgi:hypothetical protein
MVWTVGPQCQPLRSIICSTRLLATYFYFSKPLTLIMFMDNAIWWDLDVSLLNKKPLLCRECSWLLLSGGSSMSASLSNKPMLYIYFLIMFIVAAVEWVLDVSLSEQQTYAMYVDNVHGRCCRVGPRCQTI